MPALKPRVRADLTVVHIEGEAVVYDPESVRVHHLNPAATVIFQLCDGSGTVRELAEDIAETLNLPEADVLPQVRRVVTHFRQAGMLHGKRPKIEGHAHGRHS